MNQDNRELKCQFCDKIFRSSSGRWYHEKNTHSISTEDSTILSTNEFKCQYCDHSFRSRGDQFLHLKKKHNDILEETKTFNCVYCEERFSQHHILLDHIEVIHKTQPDIERKIQCRLCECKFRTRQAKLIHMKKKHGSVSSVETDYKCLVCSKYFFSHAGWKKHEKRCAKLSELIEETPIPEDWDVNENLDFTSCDIEIIGPPHDSTAHAPCNDSVIPDVSPSSPEVCVVKSEAPETSPIIPQQRSPVRKRPSPMKLNTSDVYTLERTRRALRMGKRRIILMNKKNKASHRKISRIKRDITNLYDLLIQHLLSTEDPLSLTIANLLMVNVKL